MSGGPEKIALSLEGVSKSYGSVRAVNGLDLVVQTGEFVAMLGPNGAGKSTLFQMLSGLFVPDAGRIVVMGHDIARDPVPALAEIGIVFQQATLDLELSVEGNLLFHAGLHGMPRRLARQRIDASLERMGLSDRRRSRVAQLSGGNRRRVELARALLHEPRVLLMDEPTVGLDPVSRTALLTLVLDLCKESGVSTLWATHLTEEITHGDRVVVMNHGYVIADTTPAGLLDQTGETTIESAFIRLTDGTETRRPS